MAKFLGILLWFIFLGFAVIAGWSYLAILYLYIKRTLSLQNRLEFDWWATWGFRVAFLFFLFCALLWGTLSLFWLAGSSWVDYVILLLLIFVDASLFGLLIGHFALMFYKVHDVNFFKREVRKKKLSMATRKTTKKEQPVERPSFQDSVKYLFMTQTSQKRRKNEPSDLSVSFMKIFIFALLGSIIAYWFLHTVIIR